MILLWVTLLLLHQGCALVPVITVHLGEATTFTCDLPEDKYGSGELFWYRQTIGDTLELVVTFMNYANPTYGPRYSDSRLKVSHTEKMSNLTILKTVQEDEGMYHCAFTDWTQTVWHGTYLLIKGNTVGTSNYRVVQSLTTSDSLRPEEYVTLQCSVLSNLYSKTCSEDLSVFWLRSNTPGPYIMFIDGDKTDRCQKKTDYQTRCVYNFSKNISSIDVGTYYCAVAACGEILFGNGTNLGIHGSTWSPESIKVIYSLSAVLAISLIGMAVLVSSINGIKCGHCQDTGKVQGNCGQNRQQRDEDIAMYSAAIFTMMKTDNTEAKNSAERKMMFTAVKAFGL